MKLYLIQHGLAKSKEEDERRPLSDTGLAELRRINAFVATHKPVAAAIMYHSGKLRARQTAEVLAEQIKPGGGIHESHGLAPMDDPAIWAEKLARSRDNTILVGHLPHLQKLASLLLGCQTTPGPVRFCNAGLICLGRDESNRWVIDWIVTPEILV